MKRIVLSALIGLVAPLIFILGASPFEVTGQNSLKEILAGSIAVILYFAICEFWVDARLGGPPHARWAVPLATVLSCLVVSSLLALQGGQAWLFSGLPIFVSGCLGITAALVLAGRRRADAPPSLQV